VINAAADLARRLARDAEAVCRHYLFKGRRSGCYWIIGDVQNTPGQSLYVRCKVQTTARARLANGPMPRPASMAICSI
jgi:hypothetical protein